MQGPPLGILEVNDMAMTSAELEAQIADIDVQLAALVSDPEGAVDKRVGSYSEANSQKYRMLSELREKYLQQLKEIPHEETDYFDL